MRTQKLKIGDILEVRTPRGLAYVQYSHYKKPYGTLIRVLSNFYQSRPMDFSQIAQGKELYFVFCPIEALVVKRLLEVVANEKIPDTAKGFPVMRERGLVRPVAKGGGVSHWSILEGEEKSRVEKLTPDQAKLSIASIWNLGMLVHRLTEGWLPEMDMGVQKTGVPNTMEKLQGSVPGIKGIRHFLYVETEAAARQIQQRISARPWSVEVRPSAEGRQWLVLVSDPKVADEDSLSDTRTQLETLAIEFKGEYDGWEMDMG